MIGVPMRLDFEGGERQFANEVIDEAPGDRYFRAFSSSRCIDAYAWVKLCFGLQRLIERRDDIDVHILMDHFLNNVSIVYYFLLFY